MITVGQLKVDHKSIGHCSKCGNEVYKEKVLTEYAAYCLVCDENLYNHEFISSDTTDKQKP